jgi:hypothetical protein
MDIIQVDSCNFSVYLFMSELRRRVFCHYRKKPNENGLFELDSQIGGNVLGYLLYEKKSPIGLAAVKAKSGEQYFEV